MLRYLRRLADRDLALDRAMIPLGSCTMKLNATTEMIPVTWPEFGADPPLRPARPGRGLPRADRASSRRRSSRSPATTPCRCSPTPARQGEFAGLLAIRRYHRSRGDDAPRRVPDPGLGPRHQRRQRGDGRHARSWSWPATTTATSTSTTCGPRLDAARRPPRRASWSPTRRPTACSRRPSPRSATSSTTHGGQVYLDGANLNALVGVAQPGRFGADVSPPQPPQDVLHPPRRRRSRRRAGRRCARTWRRSCPNHPLVAEAGPATGAGPDRRRAVGLGRHPAHLVGLHHA